jgi:Spx/MgsR family transcriptional regulator
LRKKAALLPATDTPASITTRDQLDKNARTIFLTITIYGIPNCDTMKKARTWLESHGVAYVFHDYRADGLEEDRLQGWIGRLGWEVLLNKASATFRALSDADKQGLDAGRAKALMLANPTMIKRPVLDLGDRLLVGFKPAAYGEAVRA